jgi:hypothetical protein
MFAQTNQGAACANARGDWRHLLAICVFWTRLLNGQQVPFYSRSNALNFWLGWLRLMSVACNN